MRTFRSLDEIRSFYLPKACERERLSRMTPAEHGAYVGVKMAETAGRAVEDALNSAYKQAL